MCSEGLLSGCLRSVDGLEYDGAVLEEPLADGAAHRVPHCAIGRSDYRAPTGQLCPGTRYSRLVFVMARRQIWLAGLE